MCIRFSLMLDIRFRSRYLKYHKAVKKNLWRNRIKPYMYAHILLQESASNSIGKDTYGITQIA
jgi:hypothetical protein